MEIKVLGRGCTSCDATVRKAKEAVAETQADAKIVRVTDYMEIVSDRNPFFGAGV